MTGVLSSFFFIFLAEMGDKTQLVALSFATKFKPWKVVAGIFIGTLVSHLMAVIIGQNLSLIIPMKYLKVIVGLSFIGFGLWTLKGDKYDEKKEKKWGRLGPIVTIAIAFFLAELGDKTQLATISLAAQYRTLFGVLAGSTLGMVCADGLAIVLGTLAGKKLPEKTIKYFSAVIFIVFGLVILTEALRR
ncbi:MAG: TMEM165/GDT1 family protein [Candidatus Omnitrophica bacterium]|nr:TMEM165/GDT1 family protein [Candidatus Omnitrophota bacterium]